MKNSAMRESAMTRRVTPRPKGLRNVLIISATPYQWKHIIGQRVCRRNTDETRIVLLKIWKELYALSPVLFAPSLVGPFCQMDKCLGENDLRAETGGRYDAGRYFEGRTTRRSWKEAAHED